MTETAQRAAFLRATREAWGFTQAGFAAFLGVHAQSVAFWERGERPIPNPAFHLCEILDVVKKEVPSLPFDTAALSESQGFEGVLRAIVSLLRLHAVKMSFPAVLQEAVVSIATNRPTSDFLAQDTVPKMSVKGD